MTDTIAQEAPAKPKRTMSAEHKAKLLAGREKWNASKKNSANSASAPVVVEKTVVPRKGGELVLTPAADVAALQAEIAELKKRLGGMSPEEVAALPTEECYYEYLADLKSERDEPIGEKLTDPADPRIDELIRTKVIVIGHIIVNTLVRAKSGEIIERVNRCCVPARTPQAARSMMQARVKNPTGQWY